MAVSNCELSIVIPAYNEEKRIGNCLSQAISYLKDQPFSYEIIVVDDGSRDKTSEMVEERLAGVSHRILRNMRNRGKGHAVRQGMLAAEGDYILFMDADLSTPIEEVSSFLEALKTDYDVVIGSRAVEGANIEVHQNALREAMGKIFNFVARALVFRGVRDSQCGFKGFRKAAAQDLFSRQKLTGFSFDAEIIFLAQRFGYRLLEKPVTWRNSTQSRVRIFSHPFQMLLDVLKIRWLHRATPARRQPVSQH